MSGSAPTSKTIENKDKIEEYIAEKGKAGTGEIANYLGLSEARARALIAELRKEGVVKPVGNGRARQYVSAGQD